MVTFRRRDGSGTVEYRWITEDRDRHGNIRLYVRRGASKKIRLRSTPGTTEFDEEYRAALATIEEGGAPPPDGGEGDQRQPSVPGSLRWLCERYYRSAEYRALDERTQYVRRGILDRFCRHRAGGARPYRLLDASHIATRRDEMTSAPEGANGITKALRQVFKWAMQKHVNLAARNPAADVPYLKGNPDGFHSWTPEEVEQYEKRHPVGTKARLAMALLLYTGARRSDVVRLGRQMVRDGWLTWTAHKGRNRSPVEISIPLLAALREAIEACPSGHMTYLVTEFGKPFTPEGFGNKFKDWCKAAGLPHCSAHGLRKAGAAHAAEQGATEHQLMAIYGWKTIKEAERYTRAARRRKMAGAATLLLDRSMPDEEQQKPNILVSPSAGVMPGGTKSASKPLKNNKAG